MFAKRGRRSVATTAAAGVMMLVHLRHRLVMSSSSSSSLPGGRIPSSKMARAAAAAAAGWGPPRPPSSSMSLLRRPRHMATTRTKTRAATLSSSSAFTHHRPRLGCHRPSSSAAASSRDDDGNYRASAVLVSSSSTTAAAAAAASQPSSPPGSFPGWWAREDDDSRSREFVKFDRHVAHVVVPAYDGDDGGTAVATTCEEVVRWVLRASSSALNDDDGGGGRSDSSLPPGYECDEDDEASRLSRVRAEWNEGEEASSSGEHILDPSYRHDPTLLPRTTTTTDGGPNLVASELLALGSVWRLPRDAPGGSSSSGGAVDRFDPGCGSKPTRLDVGDADAEARPGDYFRVHFDPRRFVDANSYDWGGSVVPSAVDDEKNDFDYFDGLPYSTSGGEGAGGMTTDCGTNYNKPGVVVKRDDVAGYIIIDKPPNVPVHARVDNRLENVASCVGRMLWMERRRLRLRGEGGSDLDDADDAGGSCADDADGSTSSTADASPDDDARQRRGGRRVNQRKQKVEPLVYVGTPQRLDQNTSGLLVVATRKSFASYFAGLLRSKTSGQLRGAGAPSPSCGVHKSYRCLVCILAPPGGDAANPLGGGAAATARSEMDRLERYSILRHFLEPSIRSPKRFESAVPDGAEDADSWAECLLRITRISEAHSVTVDAGPPSVALARSLWGEHGRPDECVAIAEIVVELLTGRTHQIRGQLAAEGFPLVGDVQYGGAVPNTSLMYRERCEGRAEGFLDSERLALQCCSLEFLDPRRGDDGLSTDSDNGPGLAMRSERWNSFRLDSAFWTSSLDQYTKDMAKLAPLGTKGPVTH